MLRISILTPTILRSTLIRTCESISKQKNCVFEHIVIIDKPELEMSDAEKSMIKLLHFDNGTSERKFYNCDRRHNDVGNTCKHNAFKYITGDYVLSLDDDDYYLHDNDLFNISRELIKCKKPDWAVFPILRFSQRFFNLPPRKDRTCSNQYIYKRYIKGRAMQFPNTPDYNTDGQFLDQIRGWYPNYAVLMIPEVASVDQQSMGK